VIETRYVDPDFRSEYAAFFWSLGAVLDRPSGSTANCNQS